MKNLHNAQPKHNRLSRRVVGATLAIAALAACSDDATPKNTANTSTLAANTGIPAETPATFASTETALPNESNAELDTTVAEYARSIANDIEAVYIDGGQDPRHYQVSSSIGVNNIASDVVTKYLPNSDGTFARTDMTVTYDAGTESTPYNVYSPLISVEISQATVTGQHDAGGINANVMNITQSANQHWEITASETGYETAIYTTDPSSTSKGVFPITLEGVNKLGGHMQNVIDDLRLTPGADIQS